MFRNQRLRRTQGEIHWIERLLEEFQRFKHADHYAQREIASGIAFRWNLKENTVQRQFAALLFLDDLGIDVRTVNPGVTFAALESAAKAVRANPDAGRLLLDEILLGNMTSREAIWRYKQIIRDNPNFGKHGGFSAFGQREVSLPYLLEPKELTNRAGENLDTRAQASENSLGHHRSKSTAYLTKGNVSRHEPARMPDFQTSLMAARLASSLLPLKGDVEVDVRIAPPTQHSGHMFTPFISLGMVDKGVGSIFVLDERHQRDEGDAIAFLTGIALALLSEDRVHAYYGGTRPLLRSALNAIMEAKQPAFEWFAFNEIRPADIKNSTKMLSQISRMEI